MTRLVIFLIMALALTGCSGPKLSFFDCTWIMPYEMKVKSDGSYYRPFRLDNSDSYATFSFGKKAATTDPRLIKSEKIQTKHLDITHFQTANEISVYVISRDGYDGNIVVINEDYKSFLSSCEER